MKVYGDLQLATLSCGGGIASLNNGNIELYGTNLIAGYALVSSCGLQGTANIKTMGTNHTLDASLASTHEIPNFNLNHSGTLTLVGSPKFVGSYQKISGSINPGTTTVTFAGGMTIISNGSAFYDLVIEGAGTTTLIGTLLAYHDLSFDEKTAGGSSINGGTLQVGRNISNLDNLGITGTTSISLQASGSPTSIHQNGGEFPKGNWTISSTGTVQLLSALNLSGASQNLTLSTGVSSVLDMSGFNLTVGNILTLDSNTKIITGCGILTPSSGANLVNNGTIVDGSNVNLSINDVTVNEGSDAIFTVNLSAASCKNVTFNYATSDGTAVTGVNYTSATGSKTITAGNTSTTITVSSLSDNYYREGTTRTFNLTLSSVTGSNVVDNVGIGAVTDIDAQPTIQWTTSAVTVSETSGTVTLNYSLNKPSTQAISASWATSDNGAIAGTNYTSGSGSINIAAGQTAGSISVTILDSAGVCQSNMIFNTTLSAPTNATLGTISVISTILTESDFPTISIGNVSATEGQVASVPITLSAVCSSTDITVNYTTANGTASSGTDYGAVVSRSTKVYAGSLTGYAPVTTYDNLTVEGSRSFTVSISSPDHGSITTSSSTVTINEDDVSTSVATDIQQVAVRGNSICVLTAGGAVKCWGMNLGGSAGDGVGARQIRPATVVGLSSGVSKIAVGGLHYNNSPWLSGTTDSACAVLTDGTMKCWGKNTTGQLGDGTQTNRLSPVLVSGISSGATDVSLGVASSGYSTTCAIVNSKAKCWGYNNVGQVGNGVSGANVLTPTDVGLNAAYTVLQIGVGSDHACALVNDGSNNFIQCWGKNSSGQLGDGTQTDSLVPVTVTGSTGSTSLAVGAAFNCAVIAGGAYCWGNNNQTQIGITGTNPVLNASAVVGMGTDVVSVVVGGDSHQGAYFACALKNTGAVYCWGASHSGMAGAASGTVYPAAVVAGASSGVTAIGAGGGTACAITSTGGLKCWGNTPSYEIDPRMAYANDMLQSVINLGSGLSSISSGGSHSCGVLSSTGGIKCWGYNNLYQLGNGTSTSTGTPVDVTAVTSGAVKVAAGGPSFTCALINDGSIKCWGQNNVGQLGIGSVSGSVSTPSLVSGISTATSIAAGYNNHACAIISGGTVKCWGSNTYGQLGNNSNVNSSSPVDVIGVSNATSLSLGYEHSCAVISDGSIKCWGRNNVGQLGDASNTDRWTAINVNGVSSGTTSLAAYNTTCAVISGAVKCWGEGSYGQIGNGVNSDRNTSDFVTGLSAGWKEVTVGDLSACARNNNGSVKCWGRQTYGNIMNGVISLAVASAPTDALGAQSGVIGLSSNAYAHCLLLFDGQARCAGNLTNGQIGAGILKSYTNTPTDVLFP